MLNVVHKKVFSLALLVIALFIFAPTGVAHGQTWSAQTLGASDNIRSVSFINSTTGWVVGGSSIFTTANGGSTWSAQTSGTTNPLLGVYFVNATNGWAVGASDDIRVTIDGGATWSAQTSGLPGDSNLRSVFFIDANTGWAVGDAGVIIATTNGGSTWSAQTSGTANALRSVSFVNSTTGWAVGDSGVILTTTNGGSTWSAQTSGTSDDLQGVLFVDANTGWAVGGSSRDGTQSIVATTNGGSTWSAQTSGTTDFLTGVSFVDANTGWVVSDTPTILTTTNGGTTWSAQTSGTVNSLYAVNFVNSTTGWAVGDSGTILKFTGASSGSSSSNSRHPTSFEDRRQQLVSRLAPSAPFDAQVIPLPCRNNDCPVDIEFKYDPYELHRGATVTFTYNDDARHQSIPVIMAPTVAGIYRLSVTGVGSNHVVFGRLCATIGALQSCTPISGSSDIRLASDDVSIVTQPVDVAARLYRVTFGIAPLSANYNAGLSGVTVVITKKTTDGREEVVKKFYHFMSRDQLLHESLPAGSYEFTFIPRNINGKDGGAVTKIVELNGAPMSKVISKEKRTAIEVDASKEFGKIKQQLFMLFDQLKALLNARLWVLR